MKNLIFTIALVLFVSTTIEAKKSILSQSNLSSNYASPYKKKPKAGTKTNYTYAQLMSGIGLSNKYKSSGNLTASLPIGVAVENAGVLPIKGLESLPIPTWVTYGIFLNYSSMKSLFSNSNDPFKVVNVTAGARGTVHILEAVGELSKKSFKFPIDLYAGVSGGYDYYMISTSQGQSVLVNTSVVTGTEPKMVYKPIVGARILLRNKFGLQAELGASTNRIFSFGICIKR